MDLQNMHIGLKIKKIRELKNLSQTHLAQQLGMSQSAYSKIEIGETEVTYSKLEKISEALELKPEDIIRFNDSMVFNVMHNIDGNNGFVINNNFSEKERTLYEDRIASLEDQIAFLKTLVEKAKNS
ncbi:MAG: XRE family transcriptional regulator [Flavobacteriia bacterium]|nr:XRE family transcriptional regulator [Flavobacteriia bacterium]